MSKHESFRTAAVLLMCAGCTLLGSVAGYAGSVNAPVIQRIDNPAPADEALFGQAVVRLDDLNADGVDDLAVGAPGADKVYVYSGANPSVLIRTISDPEGLTDYWFGHAVADMGDVTGDGVGDIAVGAPTNPNVLYPTPPPVVPPPPGGDVLPQPVPASAYALFGRVFIFSGATGQKVLRVGNSATSEPFTKRFLGWALSPLGDINGDNCPDLAVSAPVRGEGQRPGKGSVYAVSGCSGSVIWETEEPTAQELASFGMYMEMVADLPPGGSKRLLVAAPFHDYNPAPDEWLFGGRAYLVDGGNGAILRTHDNPGPTDQDRFGGAPGGVGDQDGDVLGEYAFGEAGAGAVHVYSGKTGALLRTNTTPDPAGDDEFGFRIAGTDDKDADGWPDVWVAAPGAGKLYLTDYFGTVLAQVGDPAPSIPGDFGWSLGTLSDLDGDGAFDLLVGKPHELAGGMTKVGAAFLVLGVSPVPDEFDDEFPIGEVRNDTVVDAAVIPDVLEAKLLIPAKHLIDLNHDRPTDIDHFRVQLASQTDAYGNPECCSSMGEDTTQGRFRITVTPERVRPFQIILYNEDGTPYQIRTGLSDEITCPHIKYPGGKITLSVKDPAGRNSYDLMLWYNRCCTRIYPDWLLAHVPPLFRFDVPAWIDELPLLFPSNPEVVEGFFDGSVIEPLSAEHAEYFVFDWPRTADYALDVEFPRGGDLAVSLYGNQEEEPLAWAVYLDELETALRAEGAAPFKRLAVPDLPAGVYVLRIEGESFGVHYVLNSPTKALPVQFDLNPGSCPNPINVRARGVLPVAIAGSASFDVAEIDPATVELTRDGLAASVWPLRWSYEDVVTPSDEEGCACNTLGGDGYLDVTLKFDNREVVDALQLGTSVYDNVTLTVSGYLRDDLVPDRLFVGSDCAKLVGEAR